MLFQNKFFDSIFFNCTTFQLHSVVESNLKFPTGTYSQEVQNSGTCKQNHAFLT